MGRRNRGAGSHHKVGRGYNPCKGIIKYGTYDTKKKLEAALAQLAIDRDFTMGEGDGSLLIVPTVLRVTSKTDCRAETMLWKLRQHKDIGYLLLHDIIVLDVSMTRVAREKSRSDADRENDDEMYVVYFSSEKARQRWTAPYDESIPDQYASAHNTIEEIDIECTQFPSPFKRKGVPTLRTIVEEHEKMLTTGGPDDGIVEESEDSVFLIKDGDTGLSGHKGTDGIPCDDSEITGIDPRTFDLTDLEAELMGLDNVGYEKHVHFTEMLSYPDEDDIDKPDGNEEYDDRNKDVKVPSLLLHSSGEYEDEDVVMQDEQSSSTRQTKKAAIAPDTE